MEFFLFLFFASLVVMVVGAFNGLALAPMIAAGSIFIGSSIIMGAIRIAKSIEEEEK